MMASEMSDLNEKGIITTSGRHFGTKFLDLYDWLYYDATTDFAGCFFCNSVLPEETGNFKTSQFHYNSWQHQGADKRGYLNHQKSKKPPNIKKTTHFHKDLTQYRN